MICFVPEIKESFKQGCKEKCKEKCIELYGWSGSIAVVIGYIMTSTKSDKKITIDCLNIVGSSAVGYVSYRGEVWQGAILEGVWFAISVYSLINNLS